MCVFFMCVFFCKGADFQARPGDNQNQLKLSFYCLTILKDTIAVAV